MQGYDAGAACSEVIARLMKTKPPLPFSQAELTSLVPKIQALEAQYMEQAGVLTGKGYYDDDDAFEFISDRLIEQQRASDEREMQLAGLIDAFLEAHESYLQENGWLDWE